MGRLLGCLAWFIVTIAEAWAEGGPSLRDSIPPWIQYRLADECIQKLGTRSWADEYWNSLADCIEHGYQGYQRLRSLVPPIDGTLEGILDGKVVPPPVG